MSAPTAPTIADVAKQIGDIGDSLKDTVKTADLQPIDKRLTDAEHAIKELKVRDNGDEFKLARRYKGLKHLPDAATAYAAGMAWVAAIAADMPKFVSPELAKKAADYAKQKGYLGDFVSKAQIEGVNTLGGHLVLPQMDNTIIDLRERYGVARSLAKVVSMSSDTFSRPRRTSGLTVYGLGERSSITESEKGWDRVSLTAKKVGVLTRYSSELNEDAVIAIGDDLSGEIAYAFAEKEDDCYFNGDGTSTYFGITGVRQKLSDVNGVDEGGGLILAAGNAYSEIALADFHDLIGILPEFAETPNVRFVVSKKFWATVMAKLAYATGGTSKPDVATAQDRTFLGYPVTVSQKMPKTEANSQICALLGDFSMASMFGDRRGTTVAFSTEKYFDTDELAIRGTQRFDINVHDVGSATEAGPVVGLITAAS